MLIKLGDERLRRPIPEGALEKLNRSDLLVLLDFEHKLRVFLESHIRECEEKVFEYEGKYFRIQSKLFSPSSEKSPRQHLASEVSKSPRGPSPKLPSERYPHLEIFEKHVTADEPPPCPCCGTAMTDSGMTEESEYLDFRPKQHFIVRQHRHKYRCENCHGAIVTAPPIPRVTPGGSYSDGLIVDATQSKYCDLIPMERYTQIAKRQGVEGLPPQSLIGASIKLADFMRKPYERVKEETLNTVVLRADETPHRMLEGDDNKRQWYLWGFSTEKACFYECHDTRSGDVATKVLENSSCAVLLTDVYSGYRKAVRETNELRQAKGLLPVEMAFCNAHARRPFKAEAGDEAKFMVYRYREIYRLEALAKGKTQEEILDLRSQMRPIFEDMKSFSEKVIDSFSDKSHIAQAFNYFIKNYDGLTLFLTNPLIPIDNNGSERLLRGPVIGRKTWYGTHSQEGAEAAAIHFSLIQAAKLNGVNPREYYHDTIARLLKKEPALTPSEFRAWRERQLVHNTS